MNTTLRLRRFQLALIASAVVGLSACSKHDPDVAAADATPPVPAQVAVAPAPAPTPAPVAAPAPAPVVVAQNDGYAQGRRDQQHQDALRVQRERDRERAAERALPPRADRDVDLPPPRDVAVAACRECGVVEAVNAVKVQGKNNGVGAVAGGVGGALVGNQIAGHGNRALGGIVGAVGGGLLGNAIEKHERTVTAYDVSVRMSDGSIRTVRESTAPAVGEKVRVDADGLHDRG
jgi:outer membrane lipoprotein SlyB